MAFRWSRSHGTGYVNHQGEDRLGYREFAERILGQDAGELLIGQLEKRSAGPESGESCLGLLTVINDYPAQLGWRFESHPAYPDTMTVTTSAVLALASFEGASA